MNVNTMSCAPLIDLTILRTRILNKISNFEQNEVYGFTPRSFGLRCARVEIAAVNCEDIRM